MGRATTIRLVSLLALGVLLAAGGCQKKAAPPRVAIAGGSWTVEIASTEEQRYAGLSGRTTLAEDQGMLFVYSRAQPLAFCMRGCFIPLDIAFIGADRRVVSTYTMAVEADQAGTAAYHSMHPAQYVLEVPAGALGRAGVKEGDPVVLSGDIPPAAKAQASP